jgi:hypothetical protein
MRSIVVSLAFAGLLALAVPAAAQQPQQPPKAPTPAAAKAPPQAPVPGKAPPSLSRDGEPADDHHVGYYYPKPITTEIWPARTDTMRDADKLKRVGLALAIERGLLQAPYPPPYVVFAKGDDGDKMIVVALNDQVLGTTYRIRAVLAMLTAQSRLTPVFQQNTMAEDATFLDLLKLFGFKQITLTDGARIAHQIVIK